MHARGFTTQVVPVIYSPLRLTRISDAEKAQPFPTLPLHFLHTLKQFLNKLTSVHFTFIKTIESIRAMVYLIMSCRYLFLALVAVKAHARRQLRELQPTGGTSNTVCMEEAYGGALGCTANDIKIVNALNITVLDDGCKYPGDTVRFSANFQVESSASTRYDIGLWFAVDGDQNNDGALRGQCTAATPYYNSDGDFCGDIADGFNPQYPRFTITTVCKGNAQGKLLLPYCTSWRQPGGNSVCSSAAQAYPDVRSKCKCDQFFFVDIKVPTTGGSGSGIGDPHFESWSAQKYDFQGICDLVLLSSVEYGNHSGLDIHLRTSEIEGTSYISTAAIKIGDDKLEVHEDGSYYFNDALNVPLPDTLADSMLTYVVVDGWLPQWTMTSPRGGVIFVQIFNKMVDIKLSGFLRETIGDSHGLMGDFNSGFLVDRSGEWMFDTEAFGAEWQVRDFEAVLFHDEREPQYPTKCQMPNSDAVDRRVAELSQVLLDDANELCKDAGKYFTECVQDLRLSGNLETGKYYEHLSKMKL